VTAPLATPHSFRQAHHGPESVRPTLTVAPPDYRAFMYGPCVQVSSRSSNSPIYPLAHNQAYPARLRACVHS